MKKYLALMVVALLFSSCANNNRPEKVEMKSSEKEQKTTDKGSNILKLADFTMTLPASWNKVEPSSKMRLLEFETPATKNNIAGFYFGEREKMVDANIERWRGQFVDQKSFDREKFDDGQIFVKISGVYKKKPNPMAQEYTEAPGYKTLAAIIPSNKGPYFFKVVGEKENVDDMEEEFIEFIESYSRN
ncbi:MAG: hypothetical protein K9I47_01760 [Bacteroidales bacterium]|nr:hypothetical protein [Bacteroidales bacterium]